MDGYGLFIDYEFCTGCHACELACKQINDLPYNQWGIQVLEMRTLVGEKIVIDYVPVPTDLCTLCPGLVQEGAVPFCVHHCQAKVMEFGPLQELAGRLGRKPKTVLWAPRQEQPAVAPA